MDANTADVLAGRHQTGMAGDMVEYGWMIWAAMVRSLSLVTALTTAGVIITAIIPKTLQLLATMRRKMVHSCHVLVLFLRVWRI